jgi:hypothetical protein
MSVSVNISIRALVSASVSPNGTSLEVVVLNVNTSVNDVDIYVVSPVQVVVVVIIRDGFAANSGQSPRRSVVLALALSSLLLIGNADFSVLVDVGYIRMRSHSFELSMSETGGESLDYGLENILSLHCVYRAEVLNGRGVLSKSKFPREYNNVLSRERLIDLV